MSFFDHLRASFRRFMTGRNGPDQLSLALLWMGLICSLLDAFAHTGLLSLLGMAAYVYALFRLFSRAVDRRRAENERYVQWASGMRTRLSQARVRFQKRKEFKYFKCPQCRSILRLPRGVGEVTVTCGKCRHSFTHKA